MLTPSLTLLKNGASVTHLFQNSGRPLTIDDFVTVKQVLSGSYDYTLVSGVFFNLKEVGLGRYNVSIFPVSGVTDTIPLEWFVLKSTTQPTEYSIVTQYNNPPSDSFDNALDNFRLSIVFGNDPIVMTPSIHQHLLSTDEWTSLGDIRLATTDQALGIHEKKIVGSGSKVLVPRKKL